MNKPDREPLRSEGYELDEPLFIDPYTGMLAPPRKARERMAREETEKKSE